MKAHENTAEPIVAAKRKRFRLKTLLIGQRTADAYYEATEPETGLYLLWIEGIRGRRLRAYPCILREGDNEPLVYRSDFTPESEREIKELVARWEALELPARTDRLEIRTLEKAEFREKFHQFDK